VPDGAALRLVVEGKKGEWSLSVFDGAAQDPRWSRDLNPPALKGLIEELPEALGEIHDLAGNALDVDERHSTAAVNKLLYFSRNVGYGLFHEHPGLLYDLAGTRAIGALNPAVPPRIVEATAPGQFFFPFELLRWQDIPYEDLPVRPADRVRLLLGMSAIIRRQVSGTSEASWTKLPNQDRLPVTIFRHPWLPAAKKEVDYLEESKQLVDLYGPWPGDRVLDPEDAVRHIIDSRVPMPTWKWTGPASVLHFACHCTVNGTNDRHRYLNVGDNCAITLSQLKNESEGKATSGPGARPLVFLNACSSTVPESREADRGAFTEFLLAGQFRGVLGTLFDISDTVAAHFARVFYEALLSGRTVGEAMYDARWHLMERHGNPLGLLYTFHGNVDLALSHPRLGRVLPACP
jgi:hypothetical protein